MFSNHNITSPTLCAFLIDYNDTEKSTLVISKSAKQKEYEEIWHTVLSRSYGTSEEDSYVLVHCALSCLMCPATTVYHVEL